MTINELKRISIQELVLSGLDDKEAEAMVFILLKHFFQVERIDYLRNPNRSLSAAKEPAFKSAIERLKEDVPLQYILGEVEFAGLRISVGSEALIPRPETEELLQIAQEEFQGSKSVLDVGTGTGILALGWKKNSPESEVKAVDLSSDALELAKKNGKSNKLQVKWIETDFLKKDKRDNLPEFDLILSNPPYIPISESVNMEKRVLEHEPRLALFVSEEDPLVFYRAIADFAFDHLKIGGGIALEIYPPLVDGVIGCFPISRFKRKTVLDISGKKRFVIVRKKQ